MSESERHPEQGEYGSLLILGDLSPAGRYAECFKEQLLIQPDLLEQMKRCFTVVNLESPLTTCGRSIQTTGPVKKGEPRSASEMAEMGINAVSLANNHIMDFGLRGLKDTLAACEGNGISAFGAGEDVSKAREPLRMNVNGRSVILAGLAESEFSIAGGSAPGAYPADPVSFIDMVRACKKENDSLIVLLHMGMYMYQLPSPELQRLCRFMVRNGADAVIAQHSHCPGAFETYRDRPIFYGQGNFVLDGKSRSPSWRTGYAVEMTFPSEKGPEFTILPFRQTDHPPFVKLLSEPDRTSMLDDLRRMSDQIQDTEFVRRCWRDFCRGKEHQYLSIAAGHGRWRRKLNGILGLSRLIYSGRARRFLLNAVRSETHREALITILEEENDPANR